MGGPMAASWIAMWLLLLFALQETLFQGFVVLFAQIRQNNIASVAGLLSYQIVSTIFCLYLATEGCHLWFSDEITAALPDHLNGYWEPAQRLILVGSAYQAWDFSAAWRLPSLRKFENLFHHSVAAIVAGAAMIPYYHYYAIFFIGVPEVSAVFLCPVDIFKLFPELKDRHPQFNLFFRCVFALAHFSTRMVMWPIVTAHLVEDTIHGMRTGEAGHPILSVLCLLVFIPMTFLQFYWGHLIFKMGYRTASAIWQERPSPYSPTDGGHWVDPKETQGLLWEQQQQQQQEPQAEIRL